MLFMFMFVFVIRTMETDQEFDACPQNYQVNVTIIEAKELSVWEVETRVKVSIGNQKTVIKAKTAKTEAPIFNEYYQFQYYLPLSVLADQILTISMYYVDWKFSKQFIGSCNIELGVVWRQPNHKFYHKWAPLTNPTDLSGGVTGYLKCDISMVNLSSTGKTDLVAAPEQGLEDSLMVPEGEIHTRQRARFVFSIYRADAFSDGGSDKSFDGTSPYTVVNPYVKITFGKSVGQTSVAKSTPTPNWNEELVFQEVYPPYYNMIHIGLCEGGRWQYGSKAVIASASLNLRSLSHEGEKGFLPSYGPAFLNLYQPYQKFERHDKCCGDCQSLTHMCRLLISLKTELVDLGADITFDRTRLVRPTSISPISELLLFTYDYFILFAVVFDLLFFDKNFSDGTVTIRITMGPKKSTSGKDWKKSKEGSELSHILIHNDFNKTAALSIAKLQYDNGYVKFAGSFPCVHVQGMWPNCLKRCYRTNIIEKTVDKYVEGLDSVKKEMAYENKTAAVKLMKRILTDFAEGCNNILRIKLSKSSEETQLSRERKRVYDHEIANIQKEAIKISKKKFLVIEDEIVRSSGWLATLKRYACDPEEGYPDTELWVLKNNKNIAQRRINTNGITYSSDITERGALCGQIQSVALRGKDGEVVGQTNMFFWFGLVSSIKECYGMLPPGYKLLNPEQPFPTKLVYEEKFEFQCRMHVYQGKLGFSYDTTGLADPFTRVTIFDQQRQTQTKNETLNPTWDETLLFPRLTLYGPSRYFKQHPPAIVLEVFDKDKFQSKFVGRCWTKPVVKLRNEEYAAPAFPPLLKWVKIFDGNKETGEIMIASELLEITDATNELYTEKHQIALSIPDDIKPHLSSYRMEILFWGVRELKRLGWSFKSVSLVVEIECGGNKISSPVLKNASKALNFPEKEIKFVELKLPQESDYAPPVTLKLYELFAMKSYLGTNIVPSARLFDCLLIKKEGQATKKGSLVEMKMNKLMGITRKFRKTTDQATTTEAATIEAATTIPEKQGKFGKVKEYVLGLRSYFWKEEENTKTPLIKETVEMDEDYDWWVKYYASKTRQKASIATLVIYDEELEARPEFDGFNDYLYTFNVFKGKQQIDSVLEENMVAKFKAVLRLYKWPADGFKTVNGIDPADGVLSRSPKNDTVKVVVRVYIVCGKYLQSRDVVGKSDPYVVCQVGKNKISDRKSYVSNESNPVFGKSYQFEAKFPQDYLLRIKVMDYDVGGGDDLLGETTVDLENRFYSKHRARCGLARRFDDAGYNLWRDTTLPSEVLKLLCKQYDLPDPIYTSKGVKIGSNHFSGNEARGDLMEAHALAALNSWKDIPLKGFHLVPEHVETRSLYHPSQPGLEQGKIEMWIDLFPQDMQRIPPMVDISISQPKNYELRVILWDVDSVTLDETSLFGNRMSDIYVTASMPGLGESPQSTDVHYRSMNGKGNFNWRFVFKFQYLPTENMMIVKRHKHLYSVLAVEEKDPCRLELQVWDNDLLEDDFLGSLSLELWKIPRGAKMAGACNLGILDEKHPTINLFKVKRIRGWWPFRKHEKTKRVKTKKIKPAKTSTDKELFSLAGKADLQLEILPEDEAAEAPAGLGRNEPQALSQPHRPDTSFNWMFSPLSTLRYVVCGGAHTKLILLLLLILMFLWFILDALYSIPGYTVKKFMGA